MNLDFDEEHDALRNVIRRFLQEKSPEPVVRELMATERGYDQDLWMQMASQTGLQGLIIPEELGGTGFGPVELGIAMEEMGRVLLPAPYPSSVVLGANTLLESGDSSAQQELLPRVASGDLLMSLALTEENGRWDDEGVEMLARRDGSHFLLSGAKTLVIDGQSADVLIVAARTAKGVSLFTVEKGAPGLRSTSLGTMDQTRKMARVELLDTPALLLGEEGEGWRVLRRVLELACVALSAEMAGGADRCLEMAVEYAKVRHQYGRPIGSFQAIQHKCVDMLIAVEGAKSAAYYAGWRAAERGEDLPTVASVAKAYCSDAYFRVAAENIQVHGGIGFTWDHPAHLYFKRAKSSELLFGTPAYHRGLIADSIGI